MFVIGAEVGGARGGAGGMVKADWLNFWLCCAAFLLIGDSDLKEELMLGEAEEWEEEGVPFLGEDCLEARGEGGGGKGGEGGLVPLASVKWGSWWW